MTQGSYLLLEPGMPLRGEKGEELGHIEEVAADESVDIFRGVVAGLPGLFARSVFVPGEHILAVADGVATLDLTLDEMSRLEPASGIAPQS